MISRFLALFAFAASAACAQPALQAPSSASAGSEVSISVMHSTNARDFVAIVPKGSREGYYDAYRNVGEAGTVKLAAPAAKGEYEIRLMGAKSPYPTLARAAFLVESVQASLEAPARVASGAKFQARWTGPGHPGDFLTVVKAGTREQQFGAYVYVKPGALEIAAPDVPGDYELRYLAAKSYVTLARAPLVVTPVSASVAAPAEVVAGDALAVSWQGPGNPGDYITIVPRASHEGASGNYVYTALGNPALVRAPVDAGDYEVRYSSSQSHVTLARASVRVTPAAQEPGLVSVTRDAALAGTVEVVLDASGSMLQRMDGQRRIDIAKKTLVHLTSSVLPARTPFALRIFGREVDSCQTDLDLPLAPLEPAVVAGRMAALQVKSMARTPIGASLDKVADDLAAAKGERLVILLTDGEETCGGDPQKAIDRLMKLGSTRVNIIGLALDDRKLEATFRHWAASGQGSFFSAKDSASLAKALQAATRSGFEVLTAKGQLVAEGIAGGDSVRLAPGDYLFRLKGHSQGVPGTVKSRQTLQMHL